MIAAQGYSAAGSNPALGRIVLVAIAVTAVGAFTLLQIRARSRRPVLGARRRRARAGRDWRSLPPPQYPAGALNEPQSGERDDYGPLWRYGTPRGYGRDYGPGHRPDYGPRYRPDDDAGSGPGYRTGTWPPRGTPAPYEEPREWGS